MKILIETKSNQNGLDKGSGIVWAKYVEPL